MKIAFVCLTRGYNGLQGYADIIARNNSLSEYIKLFNASNIIFHEGNISIDHQNYIINNSCPSEFINLQDETYTSTAFKSNRVCEQNKIVYETWLSKQYPIGYKHMCHFWFKDFLEFVNDFDYIIRVDEDCIIRSFPTDIFKKQFALITPLYNGVDVEDVTVGLQETLNQFNKTNNVIEKHTLCECKKNPYTNVFIMNVDYFKTNNLYNVYTNFIDKSNGIYINRWGDLPLLGYFILNFVEPELYVIDKRISYFHKSHRIEINKKAIL